MQGRDQVPKESQTRFCCFFFTGRRHFYLSDLDFTCNIHRYVQSSASKTTSGWSPLNRGTQYIKNFHLSFRGVSHRSLPRSEHKNPGMSFFFLSRRKKKKTAKVRENRQENENHSTGRLEHQPVDKGRIPMQNNIMGTQTHIIRRNNGNRLACTRKEKKKNTANHLRHHFKYIITYKGIHYAGGSVHQ